MSGKSIYLRDPWCAQCQAQGRHFKGCAWFCDEPSAPQEVVEPSLKWTRDPLLDSLECRTDRGVYRCVRNYCDASILFFNSERLGGFGSGSHDGSMAAAEKHYADMEVADAR